VRRAVALALAAAVAVPVVALGAAPASAEPAPSVSITSARVAPGQVRLDLAVRGVPVGTTLNARNVRVEADGTALAATVGLVDAASGRAATRAVVLVLDTSGSMNEGGRLAAARAAALRYAAAVPADVALGVVTFADRPVVRLAPTTDRSEVPSVIRRITAVGETAVFDAVQKAGSMVATGYDSARIVVLTDGADTSSTANATTVARTLSGRHVAVDAVSLGAGAGDARLNTLARVTGGSVVAAADATSLNQAFSDLAATVSGSLVVTATVSPRLAGRSTTLRATVTVPGQAPMVATTTVRFSESTLTSAEAEKTPRWLLLLGAGAVALALLLVGLAAVYGITARSRRLQRLRQIEQHWSPVAAGPDLRDESPVMRAMLSASQRAISRQGSQSRIKGELEQAGMDLRPAEWLLIRAGISLAAGVLLALALPWWLGLILGLAAGWLGTALYRGLRAGRRTRRFADMLPDSLQLVVSALRSGFSFPQAVDAVVREGEEPVASEFGRALAETRLGADLTDALVRTAERNRSQDLAWLVMAIRVQREVGGNLSEVVETAVETMRERGRLGRFVRGLSAEGRLSAYILAGIPVCLGAFMFLFKREYLRPLYTTGLGLMMLAVGVLLMGAGVFWLSRMIKLEA